jgi:hypothetical protein
MGYGFSEAHLVEDIRNLALRRRRGNKVEEAPLSLKPLEEVEKYACLVVGGSYIFQTRMLQNLSEIAEDSVIGVC